MCAVLGRSVGQSYLVNVCVMDRRQIDGSNAAAVMRVPKYRAHPYNFPFFFLVLHNRALCWRINQFTRNRERARVSVNTSSHYHTV